MKKIKIKLYYYICFFINRIILKYKKVNFGKNLRIYGLIHIYGNKKSVFIGNDVIMRSGKLTNPLGGNNSMDLAVSKNGKIIIGNNVGISNSCIRSYNQITIEDDVYIGGDCKIYDTDFHSIKYEDRIEKKDYNLKSEPVYIKKGTFIGAHSIILKGVTIGEKSVIGAGSVVTKSVPDNEIWAGNPAKFIKKIEKHDEINKTKKQKRI